MTIPNLIAVTYCAGCHARIGDGGLCSYGCQWDTSTKKDRPVVLVTYFRREDTKPIDTGSRGGAVEGDVF